MKLSVFVSVIALVGLLAADALAQGRGGGGCQNMSGGTTGGSFAPTTMGNTLAANTPLSVLSNTASPGYIMQQQLQLAQLQQMQQLLAQRQAQQVHQAYQQMYQQLQQEEQQAAATAKAEKEQRATAREKRKAVQQAKLEAARARNAARSSAAAKLARN